MMLRAGAACLLILGCVSSAAGEDAVILVRHAERADSARGAQITASDPDLSEEGKARARRLAQLLKDARVTTIFTTQYKRTQQTAAPLATALRLQPIVIPSSDPGRVVEKIQGTGGNVLVVGHSNSVPELLKRLGVKEEVAIGDEEYDNLFVVTPGAATSMVRLRY